MLPASGYTAPSFFCTYLFFFFHPAFLFLFFEPPSFLHLFFFLFLAGCVFCIHLDVQTIPKYGTIFFSSYVVRRTTDIRGLIWAFFGVAS